jgi:hypothetical protein
MARYRQRATKYLLGLWHKTVGKQEAVQIET